MLNITAVDRGVASMRLPRISRTLLARATVCALLYPGGFSAWAQSCSNGQFLAANVVELTNTPPFSPEGYAQCELAGGNCASVAPQSGSQSQYAQLIVNAINS